MLNKPIKINNKQLTVHFNAYHKAVQKNKMIGHEILAWGEIILLNKKKGATE